MGSAEHVAEVGISDSAELKPLVVAVAHLLLVNEFASHPLV